MKSYYLIGLFFAFSLSSFALQAQDEIPRHWPQLDLAEDGIPGMSTDKAYRELLAGKASQTVIVAVIDSGVDAEHEDLADIMWTNPGEIAGNGIDDDGNGYIDDIHGWNFIGGKDGKNINAENLEVVRLYNKGKARFEGVDVSKLSKSAKKDYEQYLSYKEEIEKKRESLQPQVDLYSGILEKLEMIEKATGKSTDEIMTEDVAKIAKKEGELGETAGYILGLIEQAGSFAAIYHDVKGAADYYSDSYNYNWNPDFDARHIVGDNPADLNDKNYGNNEIEGPDAGHGTHVAGIIGAIRNNELGLDGVADNIRIMSVRTVPNGDERDKDVANAIIYAVDNGATVLNMSFGKGQSPYKKAVDDALRYAVKHDVILVHAAGNSGRENQFDNNYPNDKFLHKGLFRPKYAKTWIEVGAMSGHNDEKITANFSNWSADKVDVFAPGVNIYSSVPDSKYDTYNGTSMASPMVAGLAALLRSYFPDLTAVQIKSIIMDSSVNPGYKVNIPGEDGQADLSELCITGGIVNTYTAVQLAIQTQGRKKKTAKRDISLTPRA